MKTSKFPSFLRGRGKACPTNMCLNVLRWVLCVVQEEGLGHRRPI